ncbi:hypothetical protein M3Y98_00545600 [Aphelenchoides besseyi]|nr:hypothetical protein M3Y98_00545600 [Aphelenchoides besseyi]
MMNGNTMAKTEHNVMGRFKVFRTYSNYSFDGRYLISHTASDLILTDLFHQKKMELRIDLSSANSVGLPLGDSEFYWIRTLYALDTHTMLILFGSQTSQYLAFGVIDFERSSVVIDQIVVLHVEHGFGFKRWLPLTSTPNLHEGLILKLFNDSEESYFMVKMESGNQLRASSIHVPFAMKTFACCDGFLYGLVENNDDDNRPIELVRFSLHNGEHVHRRTIDWQVIDSEFMAYSMDNPNRSCVIGRTLFVVSFCEKESKNKIYSLDLDKLEWKETKIASENPIFEIGGSDGIRTLIVFTEHDMLTENVERFVFNEPDKLSDLAWMQLARIFDAKPSAYNFILSQMPATLKQKCLFPKY